MIALVHRPTEDKHVFEEDELYTSEWGIDGNWHDETAQLVKGEQRKKKCHEFFKKGEGPKKVKPLTGNGEAFREYIEQASRDRVINTAAMATGSKKDVKELVSPDPKSEEALAARKRTADALKLRSEKRQQTRRVKFARRTSDPQSPRRAASSGSGVPVGAAAAAAAAEVVAAAVDGKGAGKGVADSDFDEAE